MILNKGSYLHSPYFLAFSKQHMCLAEMSSFLQSHAVLSMAAGKLGGGKGLKKMECY